MMFVAALGAGQEFLVFTVVYGYEVLVDQLSLDPFVLI